jgi:gluconokinase
LVLSIDVGTSSVRAGFYDSHGKLLRDSEVANAYVPRITHDGGVEVDCDWLVNLTAATIDRALARQPRQRSIAAVGVSTFWHSLVGIGERHRAVTRLLLWADTRSSAQIAELRKQLATADHTSQPQAVSAYHQRTGTPLHVSFWPSKLLWLAAEQPRPYARVRCWMSFGEYLYLQLFGSSACSTSMASATGVWNYSQAHWDSETLSVCNLEPERLNSISNDPQHGLWPAWAKRWLALRESVWLPAYGDGACANIGSGALRQHQMALTIGTSSALRAAIPARQQRALPDSLWRYAIDARRHLIGGALSEGGNVYRWAMDTLRLAQPADETVLERKARRERQLGRSEARALGAKSPQHATVPAAQLSRKQLAALTALRPDAHGLTLLPFFAGERSPGWRPEARATIAGLRLATTPLELLRAGMEAVALRLATIYGDLSKLLGSPSGNWDILAGGAALRNSPLWVQIIADAFGSPISTSAVEESSARGAALLAWEALGERAIDDFPIPRDKLYRPRAQCTDAYLRARQRQAALYDVLRRGEYS